MGVNQRPIASRLRTLVLSSFAYLVVPLSALMTGPLLARSLGPEGRGLMAALLAPLALANVLFTFGVPDALTYFVGGGRIGSRRAIEIALAGGVLCAAVGYAALRLYESYLFRHQPEWIPTFNLLLLTLPVTLVFSALRGIVQGHQEFSRINSERVSAVVVRLLPLAILAGLDRLTAVNAVWLSVASGACASLFLLPGIQTDSIAPRQSQSVRQPVGPVAQYAGAAALATFGGLVVMRLDQVLMISLTTAPELAFYAVAASISELPLTVVAASRDLAFSLSAERADPQIVARFCRLTLLTIGLVCFAAALATPQLLPLLFGKAFSPAIAMTEVLFAGTVGRAVTAVVGVGLMTTGSTWLRSGIQVAGALLTALLLFVLVPHWGGMGAALVTSVTYTVLAAASLMVYLPSTRLTLSDYLIPTATDLRDLRSMFGRVLQRLKQVVP